MSEVLNPNEALTPIYDGESLVYVPVIISYMSAEAIRLYLDENK